jgi:hypothetical protein
VLREVLTTALAPGQIDPVREKSSLHDIPDAIDLHLMRIKEGETGNESVSSLHVYVVDFGWNSTLLHRIRRVSLEGTFVQAMTSGCVGHVIGETELTIAACLLRKLHVPSNASRSRCVDALP